MRKSMSTWLGAITAVVVAAAVGGFLIVRPDRALRIATAMAAHDLCSRTLVSGLQPAAVLADITARQHMRYLKPLLRTSLDQTARTVTASLMGLVPSRAVYRNGAGCVLVHDGETLVPVDVGVARLQADGPAALLAPLAGPDVVVPDQPALKAVLDRAFAEPADGIRNRTKAVVVVRDGKIIAERYAPGIGVDTPLMGYSLAKSFVNAMVGVLVRQGRLRVSDPAPIAAWHRPGDARGAITIENLMRMTTGLDFNDDHTGFDRSSELICLRHDKAAFGARSALRVAPGTHWAYSSPSSVMLSRIVGDTVGGTPHDLAAFAWHELFNPLGMRHVTLEFDGAGTFIGSTYMFASARDWARLGLLYANDGIIGGRRLLPPGWVAFSTRRTLYSGYGAGFWRDESLPPVVSTEGGAPQVTSGAFHGIGHAGQVITVLPGDRLVIVRLADTVGQNDEVAARKRLMTDVLAAVSH